MRALSAPVVLSSLLLGSWVGLAMAQDAAVQTSPQSSAPTQNAPSNGTNASSDEANAPSDDAEQQAENTPPGVIRQPSPEIPGLVTGIRLGELYTDNLRLRGSGGSKQNGWVTTIQPFIRIGWASPRLTATVNYSLTGYLYAQHSRYNQLAQHLNARGKLTVLPQHLFVDARATYGRRIINNRLPGGSGTMFLGNNRANVATGSISPYWLQDLGRVGTMMLRYTHGRVVYNRNGIRDTDNTRRNLLAGVSNISSDAGQFVIVSPEDEPWGWNLSYIEQRLKPDFGRDRKFARAKLGISRQVGPRLRLLADGGKENKYLPDGTVKQLGATFWDVGLVWANPRNRFKLLGGHRFYGRSAEFSWIHMAARLTTNLRYIERPTDLNRRLLGGGASLRSVRFPTGMNGMNGMNGAGEINGNGTETPIPSLFERRIYLMKRASATASYKMARGQISVRLFDENRDFFLRGSNQENVRDADISWRFDLGPFTTITPRYGWRRYRFTNQQINHTQFVEVMAVHQFNPNNFASLKVRHNSRDVYAGITNAHNYSVNVIYLKWTHLF
jgi:uncharacterized protein (PEP-CTERM system associated)